MEFFRRASGSPEKLGVLAGTFNPPTRAHLALARAALSVVEQVVFVLPRVFPHKPPEGASFENRIRLLEIALSGERLCSIASSDGGLFIEIARECQAEFGRGVELWFLCGRDAAERVVDWDYGRPGAIEDQLREFGLLVAPRCGPYEPPPRLRRGVRALSLAGDYDDFASTRVRDRIRTGARWEYLVPASIVELVRSIYGPSSRRE